MTFNIGTPFTKGAGYLINHKNRNVSQREEADIRTCAHCQRIINMQKWKLDGAFCHKCNAPICGNDNPACVLENKLFGCMPFMKKLEAFTRGQVSAASFKKLAGLDSPPPDHQPKLIVGGK